ncbi:MAG: hypothetical protein IKT50_04930 [Clostridia bacterium]|nr:hypothetical protein [Clostridia bacterium]
MAMTTKDLKRFLPEKKTTRLLISTFLLTLGVYFAFPELETVATFPFPFVFSLFAFLVFPSFLFSVGVGFSVALFYGKMAGLSVFFPFAFYSAFSAFCAVFTIKGLKKVLEKKYAFLVLCIPFLVLGLISPLWIVGTPSARSKAEESVKEHLEQKYPDQKFSDLVVYYDCKEEGYSATAYYEYNGNTLDSALFYKDGKIEDGFLDDFSGWMQEERKAELIAVLKKGTNEIRVDSDELTSDPESMTFRGSFGSVQAEMYPFMRFAVTFREEKPDRESFADACREAVGLLQEENFSYGEIRFEGLDAGRVALRCKVTPETTLEEIPSLIRYLKW